MKQLTAVVCLAALIGAVTPVQAQKAERPAEKKSAQYQPYDVSGKKPGAEANVCDKSAQFESSGTKKTDYACPKSSVTSDKPGRYPKRRATLKKSESEKKK
jgi:hypothetical protein